MRNFREEARNYLEGLSREDLQAMLLDAGFEVEDGTGEVIYTEKLEVEVNFTVQGQLVTQYEYNYQIPRQISISYPQAC